MDFFEYVEQAPADAILGLSASFAADPREKKVNLGAGVYKTEDLRSFILPSVKKAESYLLEKEVSKDYLPIDGAPDYVRLTQSLVFGNEAHDGRVYGAQVVGGTAALRVGGRFLKELGLQKIYLSTPTWANHTRVFQHAGLEVHTYPYFNWTTRQFDFKGFSQELEKMESRSIVLLQVSCHNPTGLDPTLEQWQEICAKLKKRNLFPFFDLSYQGFGDGLKADVAPLSLFLQNGLEYALAVSHSKNFGLYAERCGALFMVCKDELQAAKVGSRIKIIIRGLYSNPPCHGARIVTTILKDAALKKEWEKDLENMHERITQMRQALTEGLQSKFAPDAFYFLGLQKGMFSYTGLNEKQVERLISDWGIYLPKDGRINVAGLNAHNLEYVIQAILAVI